MKSQDNYKVELWANQKVEENRKIYWQGLHEEPNQEMKRIMSGKLWRVNSINFFQGDTQQNQQKVIKKDGWRKPHIADSDQAEM